METIVTKKCTKCGNTKPISEFGGNKNMKDGKNIWCKVCACKQASEYRIANRESVLARLKRWRDENREYRKRKKDEWEAKNTERIKQYTKEYYASNSERLKNKRRSYYWSNPESEREKARAWSRSNPDRVLENTRNRQARRRNAAGRITKDEWVALCNKYGNKCLRCGRSDVKLTLDHVIPLKKGGANTIENAQPLCLRCNISKGVKDTDYR